MKVVVLIWCALAVVGLATRSHVAALGCSAASLAAVALAVSRYRRAHGGLNVADPLMPLIGLFAYAYAVVPLLEGFDESAFLSLPGYLDLPPTQFRIAAVFASGALLCLLLGASSGPREATIVAAPSRPSDSRAVLVLALVFSLLGFASVLLILYTAGALHLPIGDILRGRARGQALATFSGRGYLSVGLVLLTLAAPCWALWACARPSRLRAAVCALVLLAAMLALGGPIGSRLFALSLPVSVVVVVHLHYRRISELQAVAAGGLILGAGVLVLVLRGGAGDGGALGSVGLLALTLDGFNFLVNALDPEAPLLWGRSLVEDGLLTYLPRGLWSGKPEVYGFVGLQDQVVPGLLEDFGGASSATFPVGLLAEGFLNFGAAGVLLLAWFVSAALRRVRDVTMNERSAFAVILLSWLVPNQLSLLRGLGQFLASMAVVVVLLSPLLLYASRASATPRERGSW